MYPGPDEYVTFYAGYVERLPDRDTVMILGVQLVLTTARLLSLRSLDVLDRPTWSTMVLVKQHQGSG